MGQRYAPVVKVDKSTSEIVIYDVFAVASVQKLPVEKLHVTHGLG